MIAVNFFPNASHDHRGIPPDFMRLAVAPEQRRQRDLVRESLNGRDARSPTSIEGLRVNDRHSSQVFPHGRPVAHFKDKNDGRNSHHNEVEA